MAQNINHLVERNILNRVVKEKDYTGGIIHHVTQFDQAKFTRGGILDGKDLIMDVIEHLGKLSKNYANEVKDPDYEDPTAIRDLVQDLQRDITHVYNYLVDNFYGEEFLKESKGSGRRKK